VHRPARTSCSRCLCPDGRTIRHYVEHRSRTSAPRNLIPVTNAIERLHDEFKRRIKTQTILPSADAAAMLFWALLASGQINMCEVDGWQTLAVKPVDQPIDLAA
jgi:transposase-like protein